MIEQRVADERRPDVQPAKKGLFERENYGYLASIALERGGATGTPRPELRGDVVKHRDAQVRGGPRETEMEARVIDQDQEILDRATELLTELCQLAPKC